MGDAKHFQNSLGKASGSADSFGSKLASLGKVAAVGLAALGAGAAVAGKKMIGMASDAAEVQSKMDVVFGKALPGLTKEIDKFSAATGTSRFAMREQAGDMGALLAPMLGSKQGAADMSLQFVKLATDLGSFNNIPTGDALEKIRAGLVGESEPLRSLGVLLTETTTKQWAYTHGIAAKGAVLTEVQKVEARAGQIMAQTALAQEDATRTAGSMANQLKMLKSNISDTATELGMALLPAAMAVVGGMNSFIAKFKEADSAGEKFRVVIGAIGEIAKTAGGLILSAFNAIDWSAVGQTLGDGLRRAIAFLAGIDYAGILRSVGTKVLDALRAAFNAINWNAVGQTVGDLLVEALGALSSFISKVNWNNVGQQLVHGIGVALKALGSFLVSVDWGKVLGALVNGIIAVLKGLAGLLLGIATAIGRAIITGIKNGAVALWGGLLGWFKAIPGHIKGVFSGAAGWLVGAGTAVLQGFWDGLKSKWDAVAGWVGGLGSKIQGLKGPESKDATLLTPHGKAIILGLETGMLASWATLAPKINALGGDIISNFIMGVSAKAPAFTGKMAEAATNALEAARAVVEGFQTKLGEAFGRLGEYAKRAFEAKVKGMADGIAREFEAKIGGIKAFQASLTPAELQLQQMDAAEQARQRASALTAAQAALSKAETMDAGLEKEAAVAAAKEQIRVAENASIRVALEEQAAVERTHRDQAAALQITFLEEAKAKELANLEERTAQQGAALATQLTQLQNRLATHPAEYDKIQAKIIKLLNSYGVSFKNSGLALGNAFAAGIRASVAQVERAAKAVAEAAAKYLPHSPAEKGPLSKPVDWHGYIMDGFANTIKMAGAAAGGPLGGGGMGVARAPATAMSGGGGGNVQHFHFPNYVGNRRELVDAVRTEVRRVTARNG